MLAQHRAPAGQKRPPELRLERSALGWLPVLCALGLGLASAVMIVEGRWYLPLAVAVSLPFAVLLVRYPFLAALLVVSVYPFVREHPSSIGSLSFWTFHRLVIPVALVLTVLARWFGLRSGTTARYGIAELSMLYFLLFSMLNMLVFNETKPRAMIRFYDLVVAPFSMYWLITQFSPGEKDLKWLARIAIPIVIVQSAVSLVSWFAPEVLPNYWLKVPGRTSGTFGSPHPYTVTIAFLSVLILQYALQRRSSVQRGLSFLVVLLGCFAVFFSFSRGSWLGQGLILLGLLFRYPKGTLLLTTGSVLLVGVLTTTIFSREATYTWDRLRTEETVEDRIVIYDAAFSMLKARPVYGWGFDNYEEFDERFKDRVGDVPAEIGTGLTSHNGYLTLAAEMGLVGLSLYLLPVGWWLAQSVRVWRKLPAEGFLSRTWLLLLWLSIVQQISVSSFTDMFGNQPFGTMIWWLVLGLIASLVGPHVGSAGQPRPVVGAVAGQPGAVR